MRRHCEKEIPIVNPDIPFAENLVFYAPLTEGDVSDHISGVSPTSDSGCSYTWNAEKGMYLCETSGGETSLNAAMIWDGLSLNIAPASSQQYTITGVFEFVSADGRNGKYLCYMACNNYHNQNPTCVRYTNGDVQEEGYSIQNGVHRLTVIADNSGGSMKLIRYEDTRLTTNKANWNAFRTAPTSVALCQFLNFITVGKIYAKDIRVYNRALSASEVAQL